MRLRPALLIAAALLGLGGCLGGLTQQGAEDAIEVSALPPPTEGRPGDGDGGEGDGQAGADAAEEAPGAADAPLAEGTEAEALPAGTEEEAEAPAPPINPALVRARAECAAEGGRLVPVGGARLSCLRDTRDAGRQCRARGDCEGECLARSGTCAPVRPLFGCHEVLNARGARVTECME
ncbi:hypothetical protein HUK65_04355 [Rhodobacteraceae bacterium 2376]|uniref:Uncharacterized protein n=1 Tax=Rhabdonatronobacter sediminivivens TaxID=2743469 RepID=A0A7Z0KY59_9RHOB|nr:hypothetical protein [Rhabdonatronobacter sediminivivens]NYS24216.1 hypothetical protein [Rhabdonatronobacter sediminivivens]